MFKMPELGIREIDALTGKALDAVCWNLAGLRDDPDDVDWAASVAQSSAEYKAWVDYRRQTFPTMESNFMLDYERHWGARLPFERNEDRWEYNGLFDSWVIVKTNGKYIITRGPKDQNAQQAVSNSASSAAWSRRNPRLDS